MPDPAVSDPLTGIVQRCFELPIRADEPRVFYWVSAAAKTSRFGNGMPDCSAYGCGVDLTREAAAGAAVGEVLERYAAASYDPESFLRGTFDELAGEGAVPPEDFVLFSRRQYAGLRGSGRRWVPRPFTRDTRAAWALGYDLAAGRPARVPAPYVYLPYLYRDDEPYFVDCFSTGIACGQSRDRATLGALCEVVERDAVSIVWHASLSLPRIALDRGDAIGRLCRERLASPGARYVLVNATLDLPVPTVLAFLLDARGGVLVGSSTRLDPLEAARKALLEVVQGRLVWRRELAGGGRRFAEDFHDVVDFSDHPQVYLRPDMRRHAEFLWSGERQVALDELPANATGDPTRDLATCVDHLRQAGLRPIAFDLTSDDLRRLGYWVVRVVVPGLQPLNSRHDLPFFGGSRLREVPCRLGLAPEPLDEDRLNRGVHPFP